LRAGTSETAALVRLNRDELLANCGVGIATVNAGLIGIAALFPFNFSFPEAPLRNLIDRFYGWGDLSDWLQNIILFVPLGCSLASLMWKGPVKRLSNGVVVLIVSAGLSATVEISQLFLPGRFPAVADIIANSTGGLLGFFCFRLWKLKILALLLDFVTRRQQYLSFQRLAGTLVAYFLVVALVSFSATTMSALDTWDDNFRLLVANERTGDRPWRGTVFELIIADQAIPPPDVRRAFSEVGYWATLGHSLIGYYRLQDAGDYQEETGKLPNLSWRAAEELKNEESQRTTYSVRQPPRPSEDLPGPKNWWETKTPPVLMSHSIRKSSQFTLSMKVAAAQNWQHGPARIVSLSEDPYLRNFTIGQDKADLVFRLRTRLSGPNGSSPELIIPRVFADHKPHHILVVYDGRYFRLYVDHEDQAFSLEMIDIALMNPRSLFHAMFSSALPRYYALNLGVISTSAYKLLYFASVFLPIGALAGLITLIMRHKSVMGGLVGVNWIVIPVVALEAIFASAASGDMRMDNLLISLGIAAVSMLLVRVWATKWLFGPIHC
jgi:hypothetical protein